MRVRAQMPGDQTKRPRDRGWWIGAGGILLLLTYIAYVAIVSSMHPTGYLAYHWDVVVRGPWIYPTDTVVTCLTIMGLDALFGVWFLQRRSPTTLPVRSLTFAALNFFGVLLMSPLLMHVGSPVGELFGWLALATLWGIIFAIGVGIANGLSPPKPA